MNAELKEPYILDKFYPHDFDLHEIRSSWEPPCWISIYSVLRPTSATAKAAFILPIKYEFKVDAFAKRSMQEQLYSHIWKEIKERDSDSPQWAQYLLERIDQFQEAIKNPSRLLIPPLCFIPRSEFRNAQLDEVINRPCDEMEIYLAYDTNYDKRGITVLRIHSSLMHSRSRQAPIWYEKKIPWRLEDEDVLFWFHATLKKLSKKKQPKDYEAWDRKLLIEHPELEVPIKARDNAWGEPSRITFVFGTLDQVGYAALFHLNMNLIEKLIRKESVIEIRTSLKRRFDNTIEKDWIFYLFTPSPLHAEVLENLLLKGSDTHFGIGPHITGIIACHENLVNCIGVDKQTIKAYCDRPNMILASYDPIRFKHKVYSYRPKDSDLQQVTESL